MGIPNLVILNNVVCYPGQRIFITEGISLNQKGSLCPSRVNFRVNNPINFPWPSSHVNGRKWLIKITRFLLQCHPDSRTTWLFVCWKSNKLKSPSSIRNYCFQTKQSGSYIGYVDKAIILPLDSFPSTRYDVSKYPPHGWTSVRGRTDAEVLLLLFRETQ